VRKELQKLLGQTAIYGLSTILGRLINFLLVPLFTDEFTTAEFGTVSKLYSYSAFLFVLLLFGMETAFFRFVKKHTKSYSTAVISVSFISIALICFLFSQLNSIAVLINEEQALLSVQLILLLILFDVLAALPFAKLRTDNKASYFAMVKLTNIALTVGLNLFFLYYAKGLYDDHKDTSLYDPSIGVAYIFISNAIASFVTLLLLLPQLLKVKLKEVSFSLFKQMFRYAWPLMLLGLAGIINETLDRIMLDYLLEGTDFERRQQIGIYGACYKISIFISLFIQAYRYAAEPFFFDKSSEKNAQKMYATLMNYFVIIISLALLVILLFQNLFNMFIDDKFHEGVGIVPILLYANLFLGIYYNLSVWYKLTDKTLLGAYVGIGGAVLTVVANWVLIPYFGYYGSAIATLICYVSMALVAYMMGKKHYPVPYPLIKILTYIFSTLLIYKAIISFTFLSIVMVYLLKIVGLILFFVLVYAIERKEIKEILRK